MVDEIVIAAQRRFATETQASWEDFLRMAYIREARKQDAVVVSLGTGEPLSEDEVMAADPYVLAVRYDDGVLSKDMTPPSSPVTLAKESAGRPQCVDCGKRPLPEKPRCRSCRSKLFEAIDRARYEQMVASRYISKARCKKCGSNERALTRCFPCAVAAIKRRGDFIVPSDGVQN